MPDKENTKEPNNSVKKKQTQTTPPTKTDSITSNPIEYSASPEKFNTQDSQFHTKHFKRYNSIGKHNSHAIKMHKIHKKTLKKDTTTKAAAIKSDKHIHSEDTVNFIDSLKNKVDEHKTKKTISLQTKNTLHKKHNIREQITHSRSISHNSHEHAIRKKHTKHYNKLKRAKHRNIKYQITELHKPHETIKEHEEYTKKTATSTQTQELSTPKNIESLYTIQTQGLPAPNNINRTNEEPSDQQQEPKLLCLSQATQNYELPNKYTGERFSSNNASFYQKQTNYKKAHARSSPTKNKHSIKTTRPKKPHNSLEVISTTQIANNFKQLNI